MVSSLRVYSIAPQTIANGIGPNGFTMVVGPTTIAPDSFSMVVNGSQPLVKRWNGNDPSPSSTGEHSGKPPVKFLMAA